MECRGVAAVSIGDQLAAMCSSLPVEVHVDLSGEDLFSAVPNLGDQGLQWSPFELDPVAECKVERRWT